MSPTGTNIHGFCKTSLNPLNYRLLFSGHQSEGRSGIIDEFQRLISGQSIARQSDDIGPACQVGIKHSTQDQLMGLMLICVPACPLGRADSDSLRIKQLGWSELGSLIPEHGVVVGLLLLVGLQHWFALHPGCHIEGHQPNKRL